MFITKLDVVNACLATMGETPLNSLDDDHTFKPAALNFLDESNKVVQMTGWWFNSEYVEFTPDATSAFIYLPTDALAVKPIAKVTPPHAQRGKRLYNTPKNTYEWDSNVWLEVVRLLPYDDLPLHAANMVKYDAVTRFQTEYDADRAKLQILGAQYAASRAELRAEDIRNRKTNLLMTPSLQLAMANVRGWGPRNPRIPIR